MHNDAHAVRESVNALAVTMAAMPDASPRVKSAFGKWPGLFARVCLTFHLIEVADAKARGNIGPPVGVVSADTANRVRAYMREILAPMLLRAEAIMFATEQSAHALWIAKFIIAQGEDRITARDIVQSYRPLRAPEDRATLDSIMDSMCVIGWLRPEPLRGTAIKPSAWRVNPQVHVNFAAQAAAERGRREQVRQAVEANMAENRARKAAEP